MKLFWAIFFSSILGYLLLMLGPLAGEILAFGILFGCVFRGLYLLNDLHKKMSKTSIDKTGSPHASRHVI